jgi:hypothetical protein
VTDKRWRDGDGGTHLLGYPGQPSAIVYADGSWEARDSAGAVVGAHNGASRRLPVSEAMWAAERALAPRPAAVPAKTSDGGTVLESPAEMADGLVAAWARASGRTRTGMSQVETDVRDAIVARDAQMAAWCQEHADAAQREAAAHSVRWSPLLETAEWASKAGRIERCEGMAVAFRGVRDALRIAGNHATVGPASPAPAAPQPAAAFVRPLDTLRAAQRAYLLATGWEHCRIVAGLGPLPAGDAKVWRQPADVGPRDRRLAAAPVAGHEAHDGPHRTLADAVALQAIYDDADAEIAGSVTWEPDEDGWSAVLADRNGCPRTAHVVRCAEGQPAAGKWCWYASDASNGAAESDLAHQPDGAKAAALEWMRTQGAL